jgi:hypothetical protein
MEATDKALISQIPKKRSDNSVFPQLPKKAVEKYLALVNIFAGPSKFTCWA